jgi:UDP-N-acetylglucosamine--N-acetylmuramyl-(pentapeptide) pyrophosphoryl-undecaprenol N-acetylglucosamine transferase
MYSNPNQEVLLVCSGGGHLRQLAGLAERIGISRERQVWVTFRNALSESLLQGRRVTWAPFTAPRDLARFAQLVAMAPRVLDSTRFGAAISTGSSPAAAFLPQAMMRGIPCHYIESAARADGPSLTGKIISKVPKVHTYSQYPGWADDKWAYRGSIFDEYESGAEDASRPVRKAVVSVGTQEGYPFTAMLASVAPLLQGMEVLYQTGDADPSGLGITARAAVPHDELKAAIRQADVVVSHAGVGAALTALEAGKHPVLIPRRASLGEHVDDHQLQVARELDRRGLATMRFTDTLNLDDITAAASRSVKSTAPPPFRLIE